VAAAYLQQQLLTYNPTTASSATLPFSAVKQAASAFTAPLGEHDVYLRRGRTLAVPCELTADSMHVFFQMITFVQLVQKIPVIYAKRSFIVLHIRIHLEPHPGPNECSPYPYPSLK
jgi:hypothetical protein